ncbi:hypothetical protein SCYAM73S_06398 [Streptomyces cyaneofuscatus]
MTPLSEGAVRARLLSTVYVYTASRVSTVIRSPRRSRSRRRKGSPWVLRCPASAKFPARPAWAVRV